jgi:hypothetical protein
VAHRDSFANNDTGCSGLRIPLPIGLPCGNSKARVAYLRCRFAYRESAARRPASLTSGPIGVVLKIPVIDRDYLLTNFEDQ